MVRCEDLHQRVPRLRNQTHTMDRWQIRPPRNRKWLNSRPFAYLPKLAAIFPCEHPATSLLAQRLAKLDKKLVRFSEGNSPVQTLDASGKQSRDSLNDFIYFSKNNFRLAVRQWNDWLWRGGDVYGTTWLSHELSPLWLRRQGDVTWFLFHWVIVETFHRVHSRRFSASATRRNCRINSSGAWLR